MGTQVFRRPPRPPTTPPPAGEVHLEAPPEVPRVVPTNPIMRLLPLVMVVASVGFVVVMGVSNPTSWLFGGMVALSTVGMLAGGFGRGGTRRAEADADRTDYLRYLAQVRRRVRETAADQRRALERSHPDPDALAGLARGARMWERRPPDADFAHVRVGRGCQRLATALVPPQTGPVDDLEPVSTLALRRFVRAHSVVADLPTAVSLRAFAVVGVAGPDLLARRAMARALLAQLVTFHGPDDLVIAVVARGPALRQWEWVKWLPHVAHPRLRDGAGPLRMVGSSLAVVEAWLAPELADRGRFARSTPPPLDAPHIVVVVDEAEIDHTAALVLEEAWSGSLSSTCPVGWTRSPRDAGWSSRSIPTPPTRREDASGPGGPAPSSGSAGRTPSARPRRRRWPAASPRSVHPHRARRPPRRPRPACSSCSVSTVSPTRSTWLPRGGHVPSATGCACRSGSPRTVDRSSSTSRRPRRRAWARTDCALAPPARASPSSCVRSCSG